jgi:hypothetical protein
MKENRHPLLFVGMMGGAPNISGAYLLTTGSGLTLETPQISKEGVKTNA